MAIDNRYPESDFSQLDNESKQILIERLGSIRADTRLKKIETALNHRTRHLTVVLEDIYQEQNASAVLRSCDCFGLQDVHVIEKRQKFSIHQNISMGSNRWLDIHQYHQPNPVKTGSSKCKMQSANFLPNMSGLEDKGTKKSENNITQDTLRGLKAKGYRLAASTLRPDAIPLNEVPIDKPLAILIGHELKGLSQTAHDEADIWFQLPMYGFTQSYNLSVFCALCLYDLTHRLRQSDLDWQLSEQEKLDLRLRWLSTDSAQAPVILKEFFEQIKVAE